MGESFITKTKAQFKSDNGKVMGHCPEISALCKVLDSVIKENKFAASSTVLGISLNPEDCA